MGITYTPYAHIYPIQYLLDAGADQTVCTGDSILLNGNAMNISTSWNTNGDGYFDDNNLLNTTYYPGPNDLSNGFVTLELGGDVTTDFGYIACSLGDEMIVTFATPPIANAGNNQSLSQTNTILSGNVPIPGHGLWTVISGHAVFADSSLYNTTVSGLSIGSNILRWTISLGS